METNIGMTRKVIIFDKFVIKIARINFLSAYKNLRGWWQHDKKRALRLFGEIFWGNYYNTCLHPQMNLLTGIHANLVEFIFYLRHRHVFCMPTYISFFGLINIQKKGQVCEIEFEQFKERMNQMTNNEIPIQDHTFDSPGNFTQDDQYLQCIDYGDSTIHFLILKYGEKLYHEFMRK
jgi:hypothetical protein